MTPDLTAAFTPGAIALGIVALFLAVPVLIGKAMALGDRIEGSDVPFAEPHEAHVREAIALGNDEPDPAFVARTRAVVVDELARRRSVQS